MKIEIVSDVGVSENFAAGDAGAMCSYPLSTVLANGDVACAYRRGRQKHTYDGVLLFQTSSDRGGAWSDARTIFDGRDQTPPLVVVTGGMCQTAAGTLLATMGTVDVTRPETALFSKEGRSQKRRVLAVRSEDGGRTWGEAAQIDTSMFVHAGITSKPFVLPSGETCVPLEIRTDYGPCGTAGTFSGDDARTFAQPITFAADTAGKKNLCDARFTVLADGRALMMLWTFLEDTEETISAHSSFSSDNGRTWTSPQATGMSGQITVPLELPGGAAIAVSNFRLRPDGIRLWGSPDGGRTWDAEHPIQMWDVRESRIVGEPITDTAAESEDEGVWAALDKFTFGTPDLLLMDDGSVVMTYYGTIDGICHVRACRFKVMEV